MPEKTLKIIPRQPRLYTGKFTFTDLAGSLSRSMVISLKRSLGKVANTRGRLNTYYASITAGPAAKQGGLGLLNLFGDYLQDFLFPALQQLAERAQAEPVKEGQQC